MLAAFSYTFLKAIGYAIVNNIWQAAFVWLIIFLAGNAKSISSSIKYLIGLTGQIIVFLAFVGSIFFFQYEQSKTLTNPILVTGSKQPLWQFTAVLEAVIPYISILYFFILVVFLFKWISALSQIRKLGSAAESISYDWIETFVEAQTKTIGIKKTVRLIISEEIATAVTLGFFKPVILIPLAHVNNLTVHQLEAVLIHELTHIKRADFLINIFQSLIEQILYFNPFVKLIGVTIRKERENACDDKVIKNEYNPVQYADALLKIARLSKNQLAMPIAKKGPFLLKRVERLLNKNKENKTSIESSFLLIIVFVSILLIAPLIFQSSVSTRAENVMIAEKTFVPATMSFSEYRSPSETYVRRFPASTKEKPVTEPVSKNETAKVKRVRKNAVRKELPSKNQNEAPVSGRQSYIHAVSLLDSLQSLDLISPAVYHSFPNELQEVLEKQKANPTEFIMIIKEDEANQYSPHKLLTIKILANNGIEKTYRLSFDVYQ